MSLLSSYRIADTHHRTWGLAVAGTTTAFLVAAYYNYHKRGERADRAAGRTSNRRKNNGTKKQKVVPAPSAADEPLSDSAANEGAKLQDELQESAIKTKQLVHQLPDSNIASLEDFDLEDEYLLVDDFDSDTARVEVVPSSKMNVVAPSTTFHNESSSSSSSTNRILDDENFTHDEKEMTSSHTKSCIERTTRDHDEERTFFVEKQLRSVGLFTASAIGDEEDHDLEDSNKSATSPTSSNDKNKNISSTTSRSTTAPIPKKNYPLAGENGETADDVVEVKWVSEAEEKRRYFNVWAEEDEDDPFFHNMPKPMGSNAIDSTSSISAKQSTMSNSFIVDLTGEKDEKATSTSSRLQNDHQELPGGAPAASAGTTKTSLSATTTSDSNRNNNFEQQLLPFESDFMDSESDFLDSISTTTPASSCYTSPRTALIAGGGGGHNCGKTKNKNPPSVVYSFPPSSAPLGTAAAASSTCSSSSCCAGSADTATGMNNRNADCSTTSSTCENHKNPTSVSCKKGETDHSDSMVQQMHDVNQHNRRSTSNNDLHTCGRCTSGDSTTNDHQQERSTTSSSSTCSSQQQVLRHQPQFTTTSHQPVVKIKLDEDHVQILSTPLGNPDDLELDLEDLF
ncbi:unnamed protein product [Amoebophrya sp. A120]|nr:unnamed protein product [Amoebophrya sp. A120]|eukprot:GSA120T00000358001.1